MDCGVISGGDCDTSSAMFPVARAPFLSLVVAVLGVAPTTLARPKEPRAPAEPASPTQGAPSGTPAASVASPLTFGVTEDGPRLRWHLAIRNDGQELAQVAADPRLLWFEVKVPGKAKKVHCRLPEPLFPSKVDPRSVVELGPGDVLVHDFDPRLYCFAGGEQWQLVPGAQITPHLGWNPAETKARWVHGHREQIQKAPFAARIPAISGHPEALDDGPLPAADKKDAEKAPDSSWKKELQGETFALRSTYAAWTSTHLPAADPTNSGAAQPEEGPFRLEVGRGSDADFERNTTIELRLENRDRRPHSVYFRRDLIHFEVMGPAGLHECDDPDGEFRAPDRQAFDLIKPGQTTAVTTRVAEFCPRGTFAVPGLYLIHARFEATQDGSEFDLDAYTGKLTARNAATIRIHRGEEKPQLGGMGVIRARKDRPSAGRMTY